MRQISSLEKLTSGRYLVTLEDGASFPLYGKELASYAITEDGTLSETGYETIMQELLPKRARMKAMYLLKAMDRTESQLRKKLEDCSYPAEIVENAIAYVKEYHYIDDVRYAVSYMEFRKESKSMQQLSRELYGKGISREDIAEAEAQITFPDEEKQIRHWIEKKKYCAKTADRKETSRFFNFLMRKGYSISSIQRVIRAEDLYE